MPNDLKGLLFFFVSRELRITCAEVKSSIVPPNDFPSFQSCIRAGRLALTWSRGTLGNDGSLAPMHAASASTYGKSIGSKSGEENRYVVNYSTKNTQRTFE